MTAAKPVLLTVSGRIPPTLADDVAAGIRPRADYTVMGEMFDADVVDVDRALTATGWLGSVIHRLGGAGPLLAWFCFLRRRRYEVIVTDGEQVGLPFALLGRLLGRGTARHLMIVHILSTSAKMRLIRLARLAPRVDVYVVYSSWQKDFICDVLSVPSERVVLSTFMVDTAFFDPALVNAPRERMICSAGLERRDYPTLMEAVDGLDVRVVIAAASPWSKQSDSSAGVPLPSNVEVRRLDLFDLRELYGRSLFVVMPLEEVKFQAGVTTILEAMSMGLPVLCTRTPGQTDTVIDRETGRYVRPADAGALREAIADWLDDDPTTRRMGERARRWVTSSADIERYARRLTDVVETLRSRPLR